MNLIEGLENSIILKKGNIWQYYSNSSDSLMKNYRRFKIVNFATIFLAAGVILASGYASLGLGFLDRLASALATIFGILITLAQTIWSRSKYSQQSGINSVVCAQAHFAANEIEIRLQFSKSEPNDSIRQKILEEILIYANQEESKLHTTHLELMRLPEKIDGIEVPAVRAS